MMSFSDLAQKIDAASDDGDEATLRALDEECVRLMESAKGEDRVRLHFFRSNTYYAIISSKHNNAEYTWSWKQSDGVQNALLLRKAISEPAFSSIDPTLACQIRTNLANRLNSLGRPVAANEQWLKVLELEPSFAKALANRGLGIAHYGNTLYDINHTTLLLAAARQNFDRALAFDALWESDDRSTIAPDLIQKRDELIEYLTSIGYDEELDLNQWSLGDTQEERSYRRWCLKNRLFLNPLNDAYIECVSATDVLHLPSHSYRITETPRFVAFYNLMKQEYISARYRLYCGIHDVDPEFLSRDVQMLDSWEDQALGHYTENLRSAFRSSYAIFDKVGLFLNDYYEVGIEPRRVSFRGIWFEKPNSASLNLRSMFRNHPNWPLRGLYFLSKDLFDQNFKDVAEPDAFNLARLRQQVEHRFLSLQHFQEGENTATHMRISVEEFRKKTFRLLKMAREALIYVSLAMHREESLRKQP